MKRSALFYFKNKTNFFFNEISILCKSGLDDYKDFN